MTSCTKQDAAQIIASAINTASGRILVLLSGGSSAEVGVRALAILDKIKQQQITVALADERYVPYGAIDSNATLLKKFEVQQYCQAFIEVLQPSNETLEITAKQYQSVLQEQLQIADTIIAVFGVGTDNHTAGILPGSAAITAKTIIAAYDSAAFKRITITPEVFTHISTAFVYAEGESKQAAAQAIAETHDIASHPSQLIKQAQSWQVLFNKENT